MAKLFTAFVLDIGFQKKLYESNRGEAVSWISKKNSLLVDSVAFTAVPVEHERHSETMRNVTGDALPGRHKQANETIPFLICNLDI